MCFICSVNRQPLVARRDIEVWKVVHRDFTSAHQGFRWVVLQDNPTVPLVPVRMEADQMMRIHYGYHAFTTRVEASDELRYCLATRMFKSTGYRIIRCIIPNGATYYTTADVCVAERMIFMGIK